MSLNPLSELANYFEEDNMELFQLQAPQGQPRLCLLIRQVRHESDLLQRVSEAMKSQW
jgi:hypothetical protein